MNPFEPFMLEAVRLAEEGRWSAAPNPVVGAVLVRDGIVVASGRHLTCGGPHAEVDCLADALRKGVDPADCTLVVTLEPCNHEGKTPPCTRAVLQAGIRRVVVGTLDPNPEAGGGAAWLRERGVEVETGVCERECRDLIADFRIWRTTSRPYVLLKLAATLDGRIAARTGRSQWVSTERSRAAVHELRAGVGRAGGAVLIGANTLQTDNPRLTARTAQVRRQPLAAVLTSRIPSSDNLYLLRERPQETLLFTTCAGAASPRAATLREQGVRVVGLEAWKSADGKDLIQALTFLRNEADCLYVLCEGGGKLGLSLLQAGLVDEFHLHLAPKVLGDNEARPLFDGRSPLNMDEALGLRLVRAAACGEDCHVVLRPEV